MKESLRGSDSAVPPIWMIRTKIGDTQGSLWGEEIHIFVGPTMVYGHLRLCDGWQEVLLYSKGALVDSHHHPSLSKDWRDHCDQSTHHSTETPMHCNALEHRNVNRSKRRNNHFQDLIACGHQYFFCAGTSIYFIHHSTETSIDHGTSKGEHQAKQYSTACPTECDEMFGGWRGRALFLMSSQYYSSISSISRGGTVHHIILLFINIINIRGYCSVFII